MTDIYSDLQNMFEWIYQNTWKQAKITTECLEQYTHYATFESSSSWELQAEKNLHSAAFKKAELALLKKKEKLFKQDFSKWELKPEILAWAFALKADKKLAFHYMLPKENLELKKLRDNHIFMTNQCYSEISRCMEIEMESHKSQFLTYVQQARGNCAEAINIMTDFERKYV